MSLTTDHDLELLEAFADGELGEQDDQALRARLASEPQLGALLEAVRADRAVRAQVFTSFEPNDAAVERLIARIHGSVNRNTMWAARLSKLRVATSAAACVMIGLLIGRVAYRTPPASTNVPSGPMSVVEVPPSQGSAGGVTNVNAPVQFRIVDANNQPVTLQPFNSAREAQEFIEDLRRWEQRQEQIRRGEGTAPTIESF